MGWGCGEKHWAVATMKRHREVPVTPVTVAVMVAITVTAIVTGADAHDRP